MNEEEVTKELGKTWSEDKHDYVLVKSKDAFFGYVIMNIVYNTMLIIEENDVAEYVIQKMIEHGVRVVEDFEQVRNPTRPDPIFYTPELEAQYREMSGQQKNKVKQAK